MRRLATGEFGRFIIVNGVNTALYWGLYLGLLLVLPYMAANLASLAVAVLIAYWLNARFAFRVGMNGRALAGFVAGQGVVIMLRTVAVWLLVEVAGLAAPLAPPIAVAVALPVAFVVSKLAMSGPDRSWPPSRSVIPAMRESTP